MTAARCAWSVPRDITPGRATAWASASIANVVVAAADALARFELERVLIVDFDVHHGNGTQEIFYESERVGFLSIHRYPFYPGTGAKDETGTGAGPGPHAEHPPALRHRSSRLSRRVPRRARRRWPTASSPSSF